MAASGFTDYHRAIVQAFVVSKVITEKQLLQLRSRLVLIPGLRDEETEAPNAKELMQRTLKEINNGLDIVKMQICQGLCEDTGNPYWALVMEPLSDDPVAHLETLYTPQEIKLFKTIVRQNNVITNQHVFIGGQSDRVCGNK